MQKEILLVAEAVSGEKGLPQDAIFQAIEQALATATKKRYSENSNIEVIIDQETGDYETFRLWEIVAEEDFEDKGTQVLQKEEAENLGSFVKEKVENVEFGRIAAQAAKQVIVQKVREAERAKIVDQYRSFLGELVNGTVKKVTREFLIVDLGDGAEAILPRTELIPGEVYRIGDRLRAVLQEEERENRGSQLSLSRKCPEMVGELFRLEVPEIAEQVIEIKAIARDAGSRAKIAVKTNDNRIDPVGACVGMKGSRIHSIVRELQNENIDVINFTDNMELYISRALSPAKISSMKILSDEGRVSVYLKPDQVSLAIGKGGQNIKLASKLVGLEIDVFRELSEYEEEDVDLDEFDSSIDDVQALKLFRECFDWCCTRLLPECIHHGFAACITSECISKISYCWYISLYPFLPESITLYKIKT